MYYTVRFQRALFAFFFFAGLCVLVCFIKKSCRILWFIRFPLNTLSVLSPIASFDIFFSNYLAFYVRLAIQTVSLTLLAIISRSSIECYVDLVAFKAHLNDFYSSLLLNNIYKLATILFSVVVFISSLDSDATND